MGLKSNSFFLSITLALLLLLAIFTLCFAIDEKELGALHLHPVDIEIPEAMKLPKGFIPGEGNKLNCKTCHGTKYIRSIPLKEINKDSKDFLLGGPYKKLTDFCANCHKKKGYDRKNIHKMIDSKGKLIKDHCLYCHKTVPDPAKVKSIKDVKFMLPPEKLCLGCHLKTPHFNSVNHLKKPSKEMKKVMDASQKDLSIILPLDSEGRVMCATCHSPHEKGVIDPKTPAGKQVADDDVEKGIAYVDSKWNEVFIKDKEERLKKFAEKSGDKFNITYKKIEKELLLRLPAKDGALCLACHLFER